MLNYPLLCCQLDSFLCWALIWLDLKTYGNTVVSAYCIYSRREVLKLDLETHQSISRLKISHYRILLVYQIEEQLPPLPRLLIFINFAHLLISTPFYWFLVFCHPPPPTHTQISIIALESSVQSVMHTVLLLFLLI